MPADMRDPEQYAALDRDAIRSDPVLRLALRDPAMEHGTGVWVRVGGERVRVCLDTRERTVMREVRAGATAGTRATRSALLAAADLHAVHHFSAAAAV